MEGDMQTQSWRLNRKRFINDFVGGLFWVFHYDYRNFLASFPALLENLFLDPSLALVVLFPFPD